MLVQSVLPEDVPLLTFAAAVGYTPIARCGSQLMAFSSSPLLHAMTRDFEQLRRCDASDSGASCDSSSLCSGSGGCRVGSRWERPRAAGVFSLSHRGLSRGVSAARGSSEEVWRRARRGCCYSLWSRSSSPNPSLLRGEMLSTAAADDLRRTSGDCLRCRSGGGVEERTRVVSEPPTSRYRRASTDAVSYPRNRTCHSAFGGGEGGDLGEYAALSATPAAASSVFAFEVLGVHEPSPRRERLCCVLRPLDATAAAAAALAAGASSTGATPEAAAAGALLLVRGDAAEVAGLCRNGLAALAKIAFGKGAAAAPATSRGSPARRVHRRDASSREDSNSNASRQSLAGQALSLKSSQGEGAVEAGCEARTISDSRGSRQTSEEAGEVGEEGPWQSELGHALQVFLASRELALKGQRPLVFAAKILSEQEVKRYVELTEEASQSAYRYEERLEQVAKTFEANLDVSRSRSRCSAFCHCLPLPRRWR